MTKIVHSEIEYNSDVISIHSDLCPIDCDFDKIDDVCRKNLHDNLDEWLDKSNGTGIFYIKADGYKIT